MLRALWQPRLIEAIRWIETQERANRAEGRLPLKAEISGETEIEEVTVHGKADRIDRLRRAASLAIIDYKTGKAPAQKAVDAGFALQLGLAWPDRPGWRVSRGSPASPKPMNIGR